MTGTIGYDNAGRSTSMAYAAGSTSLLNLTYGRSTGGDITSETATGANKPYTYNALGQLATQGSGSYGYSTGDTSQLFLDPP